MRRKKILCRHIVKKNRSNLKQTWVILKSIIDTNKSSRVQDKFKLNDGSTTTEKSVISEKFNDFFINMNFIDTCKILINNQFGFRTSHSSYMALMAFTNETSNAMENGDHVVGIFLDFSKAFDTVDHCILFDKLHHYGIRDNALEWFRSYLTGKRQYVTYNGAASSTRFMSCGVPQGSILGPLLFLSISMIWLMYVPSQYLYCTQMIRTYFTEVLIWKSFSTSPTMNYQVYRCGWKLISFH